MYGHHAMGCHNVRMYFNPETELLEPVAWDSKTFMFLPFKTPESFFTSYRHRSPIYKVLAQDSAFNAGYLSNVVDLIESRKIQNYLTENYESLAAIEPHQNEPLAVPRLTTQYYNWSLNLLRKQLAIKHPITVRGFKAEDVVTIVNTTRMPVYLDSLITSDSTVQLNHILYDSKVVPMPNLSGEGIEVRYHLPHQTQSRTEEGLIYPSQAY